MRLKHRGRLQQHIEQGKAEVTLDAVVPVHAGFDADAHAIARAHLLGTGNSLEYATAVADLDAEQEDLIWTRQELRDLDEDQFSLGNLRFYQATTSLPPNSSLRAEALDAFEASERRATHHRHRLMTRERHILRRMRHLEEKLKQLETDILIKWEREKAA